MKQQLIIIGLCLALGFIMGSNFNCHKCPACPEIKTIKSDTATRIKKDSTPVHVPTLAKEVKRKATSYKPQVTGAKDSLSDVVSNTHTDPIEYNSDCCSDYETERSYEDTTLFDDGTVVVHNTVYQNRLINQQVWAEIKERIITNTVEKTAKPRTQFYFGMNGQWQQYNNVLAIGPSGMIITKRGRVWRVAALYGTDQYWNYQFGTDFKISFRKQ